MSQADLTKAVKHFLVDGEFRKAFIENPEGATISAGLNLNSQEISAVKSLDIDDLEFLIQESRRNDGKKLDVVVRTWSAGMG
jgi:hypothetical protein